MQVACPRKALELMRTRRGRALVTEAARCCMVLMCTRKSLPVRCCELSEPYGIAVGSEKDRCIGWKVWTTSSGCAAQKRRCPRARGAILNRRFAEIVFREPLFPCVVEAAPAPSNIRLEMEPYWTSEEIFPDSLIQCSQTVYDLQHYMLKLSEACL